VSERSELEPGGNVHEVVVTPTGIYPGMALIDPTSGVPYAAGASGSTGTVVVTNAPAQAVPTQVAATTVLTQASAAQTTSGASANLPVAGFRELLVAVNVTAVAGTTPTLMLAIDSLGADGVWYTGLWTSVSITAAGQTIASLGVSATTNVAFGATVRLRWTIGGTTPSFTFSVSIIGK